MTTERSYWRWNYKENKAMQYTSVYTNDELYHLEKALGINPMYDTEQECIIAHLQDIADGYQNGTLGALLNFAKQNILRNITE